MEANKDQIEVAAKAIYNLWAESNQYPWQEGGNSDKQYLARKYAEAALASAHVPVGQDIPEDVAEILAEIAQAKAAWPPFNSAHEGFAVLKEEVDELWDEVKVNQKKRDLLKMYKEAKQVAAMALRFMRECCDETSGRK